MAEDGRVDLNVDWRLTWIGMEGQPVEVAGVNLWVADWESTGRRVTVAHPQYPAQRHVMNVYEVRGSMPRVRFAAGEFSNGVWGIFVPAREDDI